MGDIDQELVRYLKNLDDPRRRFAMGCDERSRGAPPEVFAQHKKRRAAPTIAEKRIEALMNMLEKLSLRVRQKGSQNTRGPPRHMEAAL